ncbi:MAG: hypothetical protein RBQ97_07250 [Acholeplasma sp.]|nr:hypothetical protein [Acholeplasma sp.]
MEILFSDTPDLEGCLEALREDIDERPQWAGANLDSLAKKIKACLAYLGDHVVVDLKTQSDFATWKAQLRTDNFAVVHLDALFRLAEVRERLTRPAWLPAARPWQRITGAEALDVLRPVFEAVLSAQAQLRERMLDAKNKQMRHVLAAAAKKEAVRIETTRRAGCASAEARGERTKALLALCAALKSDKPNIHPIEAWRELCELDNYSFHCDGAHLGMKVDENGERLTIFNRQAGERFEPVAKKTFLNLFSKPLPGNGVRGKGN